MHHISTKKLKVNKFVYGLNHNTSDKVRILMLQTFHDAVHKALITEEELMDGDSTRQIIPSGNKGGQHAYTPKPYYGQRNNVKGTTNK